MPSATVLKALDDRASKLQAWGIPVFLAGVPARFREQLIRSRELRHLAPDHLVAETPRLAESFEQAYDAPKRSAPARTPDTRRSDFAQVRGALRSRAATAPTMINM
ncbi:hypothetical protein CS0771_53940 [Catellatospora sp. IY07-71]|nr:hypothetical protein CS0771_53940 [Catellatospora sp. IY07-71]